MTPDTPDSASPLFGLIAEMYLHTTEGCACCHMTGWLNRLTAIAALARDPQPINPADPLQETYSKTQAKLRAKAAGEAYPPGGDGWNAALQETRSRIHNLALANGWGTDSDAYQVSCMLEDMQHLAAPRSRAGRALGCGGGCPRCTESHVGTYLRPGMPGCARSCNHARRPSRRTGG